MYIYMYIYICVCVCVCVCVYDSSCAQVHELPQIDDNKKLQFLLNEQFDTCPSHQICLNLLKFLKLFSHFQGCLHFV